MSIWFRMRDCRPSNWRRGQYDKQLVVLSDGSTMGTPAIYIQNYFFEYGTNMKINEDAFHYWAYVPKFGDNVVIGNDIIKDKK